MRWVPIALTLVLSSAAAPACAAAGDLAVRAPDGSRVVVQRDPLRLSYLDAAGRTVLRQVAPVASSALVAPVPEVQFGTTTPPPTALYAPFAFLVGTHTVTQTPAGQWQGTLQQVTEGGIAYSATRVLSSAPIGGGGLHLSLATSDPTGRTLT